MTNTQPSILFLHTKKSLDTLDLFQSQKSDFESILLKIRTDGYRLERCNSIEEARKLLKPHGHEFDIVLLHFDSSEEPSLWRDLFHAIRAHNKFSEVIVIDANPDTQNEKYVDSILSGGCFSYFQYQFNLDVLFGYIGAARSKYENRAYRANLSLELNKDLIDPANIDGITVDGVIKKVAEKIKDLTKSQNIIITLLKNGRVDQGFLHKVVYSSESIKKNELSYFCKPTEKNLLVRKILKEDIERRVFPNPRGEEEIKDLFDPNYETSINSCIILPLRYAGNPIGLITVIEHKKIFDYETVNELTLEQIANQIAATIRYAEINEVNMRLSEALSALNNSKSLDEILEKLAEQACRLVNGLFSYIVMPNNKSRLVFKSAWSRGHKEEYLKILQLGVSIGGEKGFPIPGPDEDFTDLGITTLAFVRKSRKLLENILDTSYKEDDMEARRAYHFHPYRYANQPDIQPSSDIAIPIFLNTSTNTSDSKSSNKILGVINVEHEDRFAFTKVQIMALEQLAEFASIAIENKANQDFVSKLYELIDFPNKEDLPFNKSHNNLEKFLSDIAAKMREICSAELITLHMVKDNKSFIIGKSDKSASDKARWGNDETMGHTFWAAENRKPVLITNTKDYREGIRTYIDIRGESYIRNWDKKQIPINNDTPEDYNSLFCFPMIIRSNRSQEKVVGVIWMYFKTNPDYTNEKITLLEKFASNVADVINYAEEKTFWMIEHEIKNSENEEETLRKIVNSAKVYFGLRGASIYKANRDLEKLEAKASSFEEPSFNEKKLVSFSKENPEGLTGHLMRGKDTKDYSYSNWFVHIEDYRNYIDAMNYTEKEKEILGSLIGIRFPIGVPADEAIGVLVVADEPIVPNKGGRTYIDSLDDLKEDNLKKLARIATESLQKFDKSKNTHSNLFLENPPQKSETVNNLERENRRLKQLVFINLLFMASYPILVTNIVETFLGLGNTAFIKFVEILAIAVFLLFLLWGKKILRNKLWKDSVFTNAVTIILAILTLLLTALAFYVTLLKSTSN